MIVSGSDLEKLRDQPHRVQRAFLDMLAREDFTTFLGLMYPVLNPGKPIPSAPYVQAMCYKLEQLVTGDLRRLVNNVPPRHGKTEFGTVMLAAWILGRDPSAKVFVVSYGLALSEHITGKIRQIMEHPHYKRIFPETKLQVGRNRVGHFFTTAGGECMACSQDSAITGFGTQYMLIDDFQKADEALSPVERESAITMFKNTLLSRFDNLAEGRILINQQRLHEDDISGFALSLGWPQLKLPAIAPRDEVFPLSQGRFWHRKAGDLLDPIRVPQTYLDEQKLAQGFRFFWAQYMQEPDVSDSGLIERSWFGQYDERPRRSELLQVVQSWDPAISDLPTADWSVGMTWGYDGKFWYLLDLQRFHAKLPDLLDRVVAWHKRWMADVLIIEGGSIGTALFDQVRTRKLPGTLLNPAPRIGKVERLASCSAQLAAGGYLLPVDGPWLDAFWHELLGFPDGRNDDQVDALTQFLSWVHGRTGEFKLVQDRFGRWRRSWRPTERPERYRRA